MTLVDLKTNKKQLNSFDLRGHYFINQLFSDATKTWVPKLKLNLWGRIPFNQKTFWASMRSELNGFKIARFNESGSFVINYQLHLKTYKTSHNRKVALILNPFGTKQHLKDRHRFAETWVHLPGLRHKNGVLTLATGNSQCLIAVVTLGKR